MNIVNFCATQSVNSMAVFQCTCFHYRPTGLVNIKHEGRVATLSKVGQVDTAQAMLQVHEGFIIENMALPLAVRNP